MGKVSRAFFENVIARHLGERRKDVAVGPANGVDVGVVRLPDGRAMISTTDPIYIVPQYGWEPTAVAAAGAATPPSRWPRRAGKRRGPGAAPRARAACAAGCAAYGWAAPGTVARPGEAVSAMHDATGGGGGCAVGEMAQASGVG